MILFLDTVVTCVEIFYENKLFVLFLLYRIISNIINISQKPTIKARAAIPPYVQRYWPLGHILWFH